MPERHKLTEFAQRATHTMGVVKSCPRNKKEVPKGISFFAQISDFSVIYAFSFNHNNEETMKNELNPGRIRKQNPFCPCATSQ